MGAPTPMIFTFRRLTPDVQEGVLAQLTKGAGDDPALADHLHELLVDELTEWGYPNNEIRRVGAEVVFTGTLDLGPLAFRLLGPDGYNQLAPKLHLIKGELTAEPPPVTEQSWWRVSFYYDFAFNRKASEPDLLLEAIREDMHKIGTHLADMLDEEIRFMTDPQKLREFLESDDIPRYLADGTLVEVAQ